MKLMVALQAPPAKDRRLSGLQPAMLMVLLGGCAMAPVDSQTSRTYSDVESARLYDQTLRALQESDLKIAESDPAGGVIVVDGRFDRRGWADCPSSLRLTRDREERQHMVEAAEDHRRVELNASVTDAAEGATLTLQPAFSIQPASAMASTEQCTTTCVLERQILDSVAEPS